MIYEVYGYTYLSDDVWGDLHLGDCTTYKEAVNLVSGCIDGIQFTGGSVYKITGEGEEDYELVFQV